MKENQNNHTYKVLVLTTKGCEACNTIKHLVEQGVSLSSKEIEIEFKDISECDKKWIKQNKVEDFPTTFLIKDNIIRFRFTGTRPAIIIARWIDVQL